MIIVTGTKRSGTSMWMQILKEAGVPLFGEAFPKNWGETIREANPHGFYESPLRGGIYYATNPSPYTGQYLRPDATAGLAVKVFVPGLCRSDLAFVSSVVATMRHWREYAASLDRLHALEDEARERTATPERLDPVLEWWLENFALIRDFATRGYPAHMVSYDAVISDPETNVAPVLEWLGAPDVAAGVAAISPQARTQQRDDEQAEHEFAETFDELYQTVHERREITGAFLQKINETHQALIPQIEKDVTRVMKDRRRLRRRRDPLDPDMLEALVHGADRPDEPTATEVD